MRIKAYISGLLTGILLMSTVVVFAASGTSKTITATYNNIKLEVDGQAIKSDVEPFVYEGRTMVPVAVVAKAFNANAKYNGETNTVEIKSIDKTADVVPDENKGKSEDIQMKTSDGLEVTIIHDKQYVSVTDAVMLHNNFSYGISDKEKQTIKITDKSGSKTILDNITCTLYKNRTYIPLKFYEDTVLPLLKQG